MLDNVELTMYIKFQKLSMTGCRDIDKKQKYPQKWEFPPFVTPRDFFQKSRYVTFVPLCALTSCKKLEQTNERSLRYLKTDQQTDQLTGGQTNDGQTRVITKDPLGRTQGPILL